MNWNSVVQVLQAKAASVGLQVIGAVVLYIVGRWLIGLVVSAVQRVLTRQRVEPTVMRFAGNTLATASATSSAVAMMLDSYDSSISERSTVAGRVGRSIGLRDSGPARISSSRDGSAGRTELAFGIGIFSMFAMMSSASSPGNSFVPVNSS